VAVIKAFLVPFSGAKELSRESLTPSAIWLSSSMLLRRVLEVVQAWVTVKPFRRSYHLASMSPEMASLFKSRFPATLNVTPEGVWVLTSSEELEK